MIYTFERNILLQIVTAVEAGSGHQVPYTGEGWSRPLETKPGLLLVGDEGVYLLGNHTREPDEPFPIAYANEANTKRLEFLEYRWVKEASSGAADGVIFLDLEMVKSTMLEGAIPFIDLTPESYALGSVDSLEELPGFVLEELPAVVEVHDLDETVDVDGSWFHYRGCAQVTFEFATKEMLVDPDEYHDHDSCLHVDFYLDSDNMWAQCVLESYGELSPEQIDTSSATLNDVSIPSVAIGEMFARHEEFATRLSEVAHTITCKFNPARLPDGLSWEVFQEILSDALGIIAPKSTLLIEKAEHYRFEGIDYYDDAFLQFLVYKWIVRNRPEIEPNSWLIIHSASPKNCFPRIIADYYGWPECKVFGCI